MKKLILISALLFIVGCEQETTFVCTDSLGNDYKEVILSKDRSHIKRTDIGKDNSIVMWKYSERPNLNEILYKSDQPSIYLDKYTYNTLNKTLNLRFGGPSSGKDCPRK